LQALQLCVFDVQLACSVFILHNAQMQDERLAQRAVPGLEDDNDSVSDFDEGSDSDEDLHEAETVSMPLCDNKAKTALSCCRVSHKTKADCST